MNITLFVPILNELEAMKVIFPQVDQNLFSQILIVDGGSKDGSVDWARAQGFDVYSQKSKGLRHAYIEGWSRIKGDYVITFSPDGNCIPQDLPKIIEELSKGYDMVIASRYMKGSGSEDDDVVTRFGNRMFTFLINLCFGGAYTDVMTIYRGYRTRLFTELDLHLEKSYWQEKIFSTVVGIEPLLSIRAAKRKLKISAVPSLEPPRIAGERKLQIIRWGSTHLLQILTEIVTWR